MNIKFDMKEMVYGVNFLPHPEVLMHAEWKGYEFYIVNMGPHPCCYIVIPPGNPLHLVHYDNIDISVHWGLTYSGESELFDNRWCIGWDYAHCDDWAWYYPQGRKWTTAELFNEVVAVIEQLNSGEVFRKLVNRKDL